MITERERKENKEDILHKFSSKRWSRSGFHSSLRRNDGRVNVDVMTLRTHMAYMAAFQLTNYY